MNNLVNAVEQCLIAQNWYAALTLSLTLPDIAGKVEWPKQNNVGKRYNDWFAKYLGVEYDKYLLGDDCYALRCAFLHEGGAQISKQRAHKILSEIEFVSFNHGLGSVHKVKMNDVLQLDVNKFCQDIINAIKQWLIDITNDGDKEQAISQFLYIHEDLKTSKAGKLIAVEFRARK